MNRRTVVVAMLLLVAAVGRRADASLVIDIEQVGPNVVVTGSGSLNLTGLSFAGTVNSVSALYPAVGNITFGAGSSDNYETLTKQSFGPGAFENATFTSGDSFGVVGGAHAVRVPHGYVSGASLSGSDTFDDVTIGGLGLTPGTYTYTLPNDTITLNIALEPSSLAMAGAAMLAGLGVWARRRRS
jgi:hypothetical protein